MTACQSVRLSSVKFAKRGGGGQTLKGTLLVVTNISLDFSAQSLIISVKYTLHIRNNTPMLVSTVPENKVNVRLKMISNGNPLLIFAGFLCFTSQNLQQRVDGQQEKDVSVWFLWIYRAPICQLEAAHKEEPSWETGKEDKGRRNHASANQGEERWHLGEWMYVGRNKE